MKRIQFSFTIAIALALGACDSEDPNAPNELQNVDQTLTSRPAAMVNVRRLFAATPPDNGTELLSNGNFQDQSVGWETCNDSSDIKYVNNSDGTDAVVSAGNCIQQAVTVSAGDKLYLTCDAGFSSSDTSWTGMGLSFYEPRWKFISEPDIALIGSEKIRGPTEDDFKKLPKATRRARHQQERPLLPFGSFQMKAAGRHAAQETPPAGQEQTPNNTACNATPNTKHYK